VAQLENATAFGIRGLKERAKVVGGWLDLSTREGAGTTIILSVPLDSEGHTRLEADFL
jgi:signal transduction histidine kinase